MSQIRKAHSVEIIDRRLRDCASVLVPDRMELIGLHDELSRVERKWREKSLQTRPSGARPLADAAAMNTRFEKLARLVAVASRHVGGSDIERRLLEEVDQRLRNRAPLAVSH